MPNKSRRARWNAKRRAALPDDICPRCMIRPRTTKRIKSTGRERRLKLCAPCGAYQRDYQSRLRAA